MAAHEMAAGEFKAKCLQVMDDVKATGREVVITKHGKPVARLVPVAPIPARSRGVLKGSVTIHGDILAPVGEIWDAEQ